MLCYFLRHSIRSFGPIRLHQYIKAEMGQDEIGRQLDFYKRAFFNADRVYGRWLARAASSLRPLGSHREDVLMEELISASTLVYHDRQIEWVEQSDSPHGRCFVMSPSVSDS
ncbi:hypothetical protein CBL_03936 [Carabus blaptoides fortunei]